MVSPEYNYFIEIKDGQSYRIPTKILIGRGVYNLDRYGAAIHEKVDPSGATVGARTVIHAGVKIGQNVNIGIGVNIGRDCQIGNQALIGDSHPNAQQTIGRGSKIGNTTSIFSCIIGRKVSIGDMCILGKPVNDSLAKDEDPEDFAPIKIMDDAKIGNNCDIDNGVKVGASAKIEDYSRVGRLTVVSAGAVIKKGSNIHPNSRVRKNRQ